MSPLETPLTVGSLFSGIGGIDLGLERAGMKVLWQVECDTYARKVLSKNFPGTHCYDDIRAVFSPPKVDILAGGFPCQDISNAGKRAGIDGAKSGLWSEFFRLIRDLRPRYVLVENVAALLARGLGRVLGDLAASGYSAEWDCIPAASVGAPHRRDRLFLVAYPNGDAIWHQQESEFRRCGVDGSGLNGQVRDVAHAYRQRQPQPEGALTDIWRLVGDSSKEEPTTYAQSSGRERPRILGRPPEPSSWPAESGFCRMAHGVPFRVDRLRGLGNAVVPQVAEYIGRLIVAHAEVSL